MIAIDHALLIVMAEALLGLLILAIALFFNHRKKFNREMGEIDNFITQLNDQIDIKSKPLNHLLSQTCKLDRDAVDRTLTAITDSERALLRGVIKLFMQREMSLLQDLNKNIDNLSQPYCEIIKKVASQTAKVQAIDNSGLEHINQQLVRQLETAMQTIDEITAEYTRVFSGNQTELELENSRKKMLKVFTETEHALRHPQKQ